MEEDRGDQEACHRGPHPEAEERDEDLVEDGAVACEADDGGGEPAAGQSDAQGAGDREAEDTGGHLFVQEGGGQTVEGHTDTE